MKKLIYLFLVCPGTLIGQSLYNFENDSMGGWIQTPAERWEISSEQPLEGSNSLHHAFDNTEAGVDYIGRIIHYADMSDAMSFSFKLRHRYNPSSGNNWQLFLLSNDHKDLENGFHNKSGLLFGVNYNCSDDLIKLWQLYLGEIYEICTTDLNYQKLIGTAGEPFFRISRNPDGIWSIACSVAGTEDSLSLAGSGSEQFCYSGKYAGFRYSYSSAQDRKLWIDQFKIEGSFFQDTLPPIVQSVSIAGLNSIQLLFNEDVELNGNSTFRCESNELDSLHHSGNILLLHFRNDFPNRILQELRIGDLADNEGNKLSDTTVVFQQKLSEFGDVVINEIMADPVPEVYLTPCEYIELYNRYDIAVPLTGWTIDVNGKEYLLNDITVEAGKYLVITSDNSQCIFGETQVINLFSSGTYLPNSGGTIKLTDEHGRLIHFVQYEEMERYDRNKAEGGWSLERIDPDNLCGGNENWKVSAAWRGGTPGELNSVLNSISDYDLPNLLFIGIPEDDRIKLIFDEPVFLIDDMRNYFSLDNKSFTATFEFSYMISKTIDLLVNDSLIQDHLYDLMLTDISDCTGNTATVIHRKFEIPVLPELNPLINEVMYDPAEGGNEYIEIYNSGDDYIDLYDLKLMISEPGAIGGSSVLISEESHLMSPRSFVVLCKNSEAIRSEWELDRGMDLVEMERWKMLSNGGACIRLLDRSEKIIDHLCYNDSMHNDLINITSGVALECISPDPCSYESQCWTSASISANYGTPGTKNSQFNSGEESEKELVLSPEVFSPDLDGYEDVLKIAIPEISQNALIDIFITDLNGNIIRQLIVRGNSGISDRFFWDGSDKEGKIVLPGIYVVFVRISGEEKVRLYRKACAVRYK